MTRILRRVSGGGLLLALLFMSLCVAGGLTAAVLSGAASSNRDLATAIETRLLALLQRDGLSGLSAEIDRETSLVPEPVAVEFLVVQLAGSQEILLNETTPGLAEAAETVVPGTHARVELGNRTFSMHAPDIPKISRSWDFEMADARVHFAFALPTPQMRDARRQLLTVWGGFALAVAFGLMLHLDHRRRYRAGLNRINGVLESFAAGQTTPHVDIQPDAPELRRLADELNQLLPRFDRLVTDLRALTAHLAHEMNTPLQMIRADLRALVGSDDPAERQRSARDIDATIDATDARLGSVMRLFQLSAKDDVTLHENVSLGPLVADVAEDLEDILVAGARKLMFDLNVDVRIAANTELLEVAVGNLFSNAGKFAPQDAVIGADLHRQGARFRLRIWNSGSAFPITWDGSDFERLKRGRDHGEIRGFGLGLALVNMIARWHGFTLTAQNSVLDSSLGSVAVVTLEGPCVGSN